MRRFALISLSLLLLSAISTRGQEPRAGTISFVPYSFKTYDQQEHPAELGKLWVAENRSKNASRLIQLAFVRLKTTAANPQPPIVFLAGGPGVPGATIGRVPVYFHLFARLQEVADVILLDQRGTGLSTPNLQCPPSTRLAPDTWETRGKAERALVEMVRACAAHWRAQGVDLAAFNTNASADDLEDLRRALGVERLSLVGHSYGTAIALASARRHGERLHRMVLASVLGPDDDLKLPMVTDFGLRRLSQFVAEDSAVNHDVPDLIRSLRQALARLDQQPTAIPFVDPSTGKSMAIHGGKFALQLLVELRLKDGRSAPALPALVSSVARGDDSLFAALVTGLHQSFSSLSLMQFPMTCSDGASMERRTLAAQQSAQTLLGNPSDLALDPKLCAEVGNPDLGAEFRSPLWSTVPTLFLSGSMDSGTPPANAEKIRWGFLNGAHIIVENGFHETLPARAVQDVVVDFLKGQDVSARRVTLERPMFLSMEQAKAQILAPSKNR